jgi:hypothetical protein
MLATYGDLFDRPRLMEQLLGEADCVFASTTFLRDLSELTPLLKAEEASHRIVVGGLASLLADRWEGPGDVDILAAGYGEFLVPSLVDWMRSAFTALQPPPGGRIVERGPTHIVYSGVPPTTDLDFLPTPDWTRSQTDRGKRYRMIYYESVRGCPYRCNFCNYPICSTTPVSDTRAPAAWWRSWSTTSARSMSSTSRASIRCSPCPRRGCGSFVARSSSGG